MNANQVINLKLSRTYSNIHMEQRMSPSGRNTVHGMLYNVNIKKSFNTYLTRRLTQSASDQSVKHTIDKHQYPKLINQAVTTFLPVMIRLPNGNCKLQDWLTEWL